MADAKRYLLIDAGFTDDDDLIADMISAARIECEQIIDRSFITTTWGLTLDYFSGDDGGSGGLAYALGPLTSAIRLPKPPLIAVQSIIYTDTGNVSRTLDPSGLIVSTGTPGRVVPVYGRFWPFTQPSIATVSIVYTAGYGPDAITVPRNVVMAIRMLVASYYEFRTTDYPTPEAVKNVLAPAGWGGYA